LNRNKYRIWPLLSWERIDEITDNYWTLYDILDLNKPLYGFIIEKVDKIVTLVTERIAEIDIDSFV
jgi:hypothetical protein